MLRIILRGKNNDLGVAFCLPRGNLVFKRHDHIIIQGIKSFTVIQNHSAFIVNVLIDDFLTGEKLFLNRCNFSHFIIMKLSDIPENTLV
jgi:hypothetical protein